MTENICFNCFKRIEKTGIASEPCPYCGYIPERSGNRNALTPGTILTTNQTEYRIGRVLGQGGFGITYIAQNCSTGERIAIKEYYPKSFASRLRDGSVDSGSDDSKCQSAFSYGKRQFLNEAESLSKCKYDEHVVHIRSFFEGNNTAYFTMDYVPGPNLEEYVKENGRLSVEETERLLLPVMESISRVHKKGIIHRDLAPDNILIQNGKAVLIDFGAAKMEAREETKSVYITLKHGYSPEEQYRSQSKGPPTDVYAMGATFYYAITGSVPPQSINRTAYIDERQELIAPHEQGVIISHETEQVLMKAMEVYASDRFQSMEEFRSALLMSKNKRIVTVTARSAAWVYDGKPHSLFEYDATGLADGDHIAKVGYSDSSSIVDAGETYNEIEDITICDSNNNDVTERYVVDRIPGTLTVERFPLIVTAPSAKKRFDGYPFHTLQIKHGPLAYKTHQLQAEYIVEDHDGKEIQGEPVKAGKYKSRIKTAAIKSYYADVTNNYDITTHEGTLIIRKRLVGVGGLAGLAAAVIMTIFVLLFVRSGYSRVDLQNSNSEVPSSNLIVTTPKPNVYSTNAGKEKKEPDSHVVSKYDDEGNLLYKEEPIFTDGIETGLQTYIRLVDCMATDETYDTLYQWTVPVYRPAISLDNCKSFTICFKYNSIPDTISLGYQRLFYRQNGYFYELKPINVEELDTMYTIDVQFDAPVTIDGFATQPMKNPRSGTYDLEFFLADVILVK